MHGEVARILDLWVLQPKGLGCVAYILGETAGDANFNMNQLILITVIL